MTRAQNKPATEAADPLPLALKVKLASIVIHTEEMLSPSGHDFDRHAIEGLLNDPEVKDWLASIDPVLLPLKR